MTWSLHLTRNIHAKIIGTICSSTQLKHFCNTFSSSSTCTVSHSSIYEALLCNDRPSMFSDCQRLHPFVWCAGRRGWQIPLRACLSEVSAAHFQTHLAREEMKMLAGLPLHYDISSVVLIFSTTALQWSQYLQSCLHLLHLFFLLSAAVCAWIWVPGFSLHCEALRASLATSYQSNSIITWENKAICVCGYRIDAGSRPRAFHFKTRELVLYEMAFKTASVVEQMELCTQGWLCFPSSI